MIINWSLLYPMYTQPNDLHLFRSSRLFSGAPESLYEVMASENVTLNNHHYGIWVEHFEQTESLYSFFDLLSTNKDRQVEDILQ